MRVAAIYDIHGNFPALEAALADICEAGADHIVVGGDVVPGPMPRETIDALLALDLPVQFIHGNGDRETLAWKRGSETAALPPQFQEIMRWNAEQLRAADEQLLASWPATLRLDIPGLGEVLFCHATPRNDTGIFTRLTPEDALLPIFAEANAPLVICGHTHMQFDRIVGRTRLVNAGSVGMPFGAPGAYWLMLDRGIELQRTNYDLAAAANRVRKTAYPQADEFAARNILQPASEEETLRAFSKAELK